MTSPLFSETKRRPILRARSFTYVPARRSARSSDSVSPIGARADTAGPEFGWPPSMADEDGPDLSLLTDDPSVQPEPHATPDIPNDTRELISMTFRHFIFADSPKMRSPPRTHAPLPNAATSPRRATAFCG